MSEVSNKRIEYIAILRGIAIIIIILTHLHQVFDLPMYVRAIPRLGQLGCQIFIVISGFFAYNAIHSEKEVLFDTKAILHYYKKRIKRIAPGYWLTIIVGILVTFLSLKIYNINLTGISTKVSDIIVNIFLINGLTPTTANNHVVRGAGL